jgi:hypothetical protein
MKKGIYLQTWYRLRNILRPKRLALLAPGTLTIERMDENGWNAIALPIPKDANKDLLIEIDSWCSHFIQIFVDDLRGDDGPITKERRRECEEGYRLARRRMTQAEWRLAIMGVFRNYSDWDHPKNNQHVSDIIENMARPGKYPVPQLFDPDL